MNDRRRIRTASVVGGAAAVTLLIALIEGFLHLAAWAGRSYRARRATTSEK